MTHTPQLIDPFQRAITYLRVSVTDRCDFRCVYCMSEDMTFLPKRDLLTLEELDRICSAFISQGVTKLRITGGEPLVRREIMTFFKGMSRHLEAGSLNELTLTTNGSQLARFADELYACGVRRINISLDTLDPEKFKKITRWGKLEKVLEGIETAQKIGMKIKLNVVALKGVNEDELFSIVEWAAQQSIDVTFIEVMPMGDLGNEDRIDQYWSLKDLRTELETKYILEDISLSTGGPARYVALPQLGNKVGFITPLSHNFCESCNRVRLTCTGQLYQCLGQEGQVDFRKLLRETESEEILVQKIHDAIALKPKGHDFDYSRQTVSGQMSRHMSHTGG